MRITRLAGRSEKSRDFVKASTCNDLFFLKFLISLPQYKIKINVHIQHSGTHHP